jgi:hypothetical protein
MTAELVFSISGMLLLPVFIFAIYAQIKVVTTFNKYKKIGAASGITAAQLAEQLLIQHGIEPRVEYCAGRLSDHYDPRTKVVVLSSEVYNSTSVAALGIAAHEVGHAIQDAQNYAPLKIRQAVVKTSAISSRMLMPVLLISILSMVFFPFASDEIYFYMILCFTIIYAIITLVNFITLPTEFNASRRAKQLMEQCHLDQQDISDASKVLNAAALTYVAALVLSLVQLLRFASILAMGRRR